MGANRIEKYSKLTLRGRRWYWRLRHVNGNIMADSAEGYNSKQARDDALTTVLSAVQHWDYDNVDLDKVEAVK
jgi:uncharacterized protein YegP (UPF0339 family)